MTITSRGGKPGLDTIVITLTVPPLDDRFHWAVAAHPPGATSVNMLIVVTHLSRVVDGFNSPQVILLLVVADLSQVPLYANAYIRSIHVAFCQ